MSGIVGILNFDGAPVDGELLQRMTAAMTYRGPDGQAIWRRANVGFAHAALHTTLESHGENQPESLDQRLWITADARIDGGAELRAKLKAKGRTGIATDAALILHAYDVWGTDCLKHLLGDFAFAIWDSARRRLFCARDQLGLKPFYYARAGSAFVFGNTLDCLRLHPGVSDRLSDQAIGDFLLFGLSFQDAATAFHDIHRLAPAHCLTARDDGFRIQRYWSMPTDGYVRYRSAADYIERFKELLRAAVKDRLRTDNIAVLMSGGLDSTSLAAVACDLGSHDGANLNLRAHTIVYDKLFTCEERHFAALTARALGIPIEYLAADDYTLYERWDTLELHTPEPAHYPLLAIYADHYRQVAARARVALVGDGGDPILCPPLSRFKSMLKQGRWLRLVGEVGGYAIAHGGKLPPLGFRSGFKQWLGLWAPERPAYPSWLNADFESRAGLRDRWREVYAAPALIHPHRPEAYQKLTAPYWSGYFESLDPSVTSVPLEIRSPYFDLRLINFLLAIPPLPWSVDKELLRAAMRGKLPEPIRLRPKTPLAGDPTFEVLRRSQSASVDDFVAQRELGEFVERRRLPRVFPVGPEDRLNYYLKLMPCSLNYWLRNSQSAKLKPTRRPNHGTADPQHIEKIPSAAIDDLW